MPPPTEGINPRYITSGPHGMVSTIVEGIADTQASAAASAGLKRNAAELLAGSDPEDQTLADIQPIKRMKIHGSSESSAILPHPSTTNMHIELLESIDKISSHVLHLTPDNVQVIFLGRLSSFQTIMRLRGTYFTHDAVLQALTTKLCNIALNLNIQHLEWPFAAKEEEEILAAIAHIETLLNSGQPPASTPVVGEDVDEAGSHYVRLNTTGHRSSMQINAQGVHLGTVTGPAFSNNTINQADPAVRQKVENLMKHVIDAETTKKHQEFLEWISKLDFQATQKETFAKHAAGTGDWFLKQQKFMDWKDGKTKFLWCPGIHEWSVILQPHQSITYAFSWCWQDNPLFHSSIIVEHLRSAILQPKIAVICIYCDYRQQEAQTPIQLLGSVLKQLAQQHPVLSDHLLALHKKYPSQGDHPSIDELFKALQAEVLLYSQVYIVVDALDESSESNQAREIFFSAHPQGLWSLSDHIQLLVTSRDVLSISQEFKNIARIPIEAHGEDLETYIRGRITTDKKLKKLVKEDVNLTTEIIEQVSLKAAGMFLQARLHLDALASQLNRKGLHKALALLPDRIMDSYDEAMARIKAQGKDQYELAHQIFYWLAYAKSPLSIKELQHAVAVSEDMTEMDLDAIVDEQRSYRSHGYDRIVQLVHYTTQEYFQQKQKLVFPGIHTLMAITCLTYLSFNAFDSTHIRLGIWKQYPLYKYASMHWGTHAKVDEAATKHYIFNFLEKKNNVVHAAHRGDWPTGQTVHILAWLGLGHILELLLSQDVTHVMDIDRRGCTPLICAAEKGHIDIVKLLLEKNADSNICDKDQHTPLSYAAPWGHIDIVKLLLEKNADPNICDKDQRTPLSYAAEKGHIDIVKLLLEKNADPNICDEEQRMPLSHAAQQDHIAIVKLLLEKNVDPNICDKNQRTPLSYAAQQDHIDIVKLLLEKNVDPNICDKNQHTPLSYAAQQDHIDIVKLLLEKNADPNICDKNQRTPLSYAAQQDHIDIDSLLLEKNADPNICDEEQRTPLSYAAEWGHIDIVKLLLAKNADSNICNKDQCTPLSYAAWWGHIDIVKLLLEKNADSNICNKDQCTPLLYAARWGHIDIVKLLLEKNADPNICDEEQRTPLSYAAERGHIDIVKLLLEKNADPNICNEEQCTPLSYAAGQGHIVIVKLLLEKNADPNICNEEQCTPLSYAAEQGHIVIVQLLLEKHADPNICNEEQCTPLSYAAQQGHIDIVKLLLKNNVNPNICDKEQRTPLSYAAQWGHIDIVKLLLEKNVDPNICNKNQRTPLSYAAQLDHIDIVKLLLEKNADPNICNEEQCTPLSYAAQQGHIDIVELLLEKNVDPNICDQWDRGQPFWWQR
ncbi:Pfs, NACHT and ankyrin domain protein [Mycena floridula]|nr:Pfs, NACHT and ankyrin domain protein [Mycena floridula]